MLSVAEADAAAATLEAVEPTAVVTQVVQAVMDLGLSAAFKSAGGSLALMTVAITVEPIIFASLDSPDVRDWDVSVQGYDAGGYVVCLKEGAGAWYQVGAADSATLRITPSAPVFAQDHGPYGSQRFAAVAGTFDLAVKGHYAATVGDAQGFVEVRDADGGSVADAALVGGDDAASAEVEVPEPGFYGVYWAATAQALANGRQVGVLAVTERALLDVTYVVAPGTDASIEVVGEGLDWKHDRIMVVDAHAACGIAHPADAHYLDGAATAATVASSVEFVALNPLFDAEAVDEAEQHDTPSQLRMYTTVRGSYCRGNNLDAMSVDALPLAHGLRCALQCSKADCPLGAGSAGMGRCPAACAGYHAEYDDAQSPALCATEAQCRKVCSFARGCTGLDMHATLPRCYVNADRDAERCEQQLELGALGLAAEYRYLHRGGSYVPRTVVASGGLSSPDVLRFPVSLGTAGSYKVCFCDASLLEGPCASAGDFAVEVGMVHATGLSCLLSEEKYRRAACVEQFHGGLRCHDDAVAALVPRTAGLPRGPSP